jgi:hypothetical protein
VLLALHPWRRHGGGLVSGVLGAGLTCESADAGLVVLRNDLSAGSQDCSRHPPVSPVDLPDLD